MWFVSMIVILSEERLTKPRNLNQETLHHLQVRLTFSERWTICHFISYSMASAIQSLNLISTYDHMYLVFQKQAYLHNVQLFNSQWRQIQFETLIDALLKIRRRHLILIGAKLTRRRVNRILWPTMTTKEKLYSDLNG